MKKYHPKYSVKTNFDLLHTFIYLLDTRYITYEDFEELTGSSYFVFKKIMKRLERMFIVLKMNIRLLRKYEYLWDVNYYKTFYTLVYLDKPYSFSLEGVEENDLIIYSTVIIYCMLKTNQYVSFQRLKYLLPNYDYYKFAYLRNKLYERFSIKLLKNKLQSYYMEEEE